MISPQLVRLIKNFCYRFLILSYYKYILLLKLLYAFFEPLLVFFHDVIGFLAFDWCFNLNDFGIMLWIMRFCKNMNWFFALAFLSSVVVIINFPNITSSRMKELVTVAMNNCCNLLAYENGKRINLIFLFLRYFDSVNRSYVN